jgi:hypothetical protein
LRALVRTVGSLRTRRRADLGLGASQDHGLRRRDRLGRRRNGATAHHACANGLDLLVGLVLLVRALDALDIGGLESAHVIPHLDAQDGDSLHEIRLIHAQVPGHLVHALFAHGASVDCDAVNSDATLIACAT